jgi:hypothetical protein
MPKIEKAQTNTNVTNTDTAILEFSQNPRFWWSDTV